MGNYIQGLKDMKSLLGEVGSGKLSVDVDTTKVEQMANALDRIATYVDLLEKAGVQIFDTQGLYASNKSIIETEDHLESLRDEIENVKEEWHKLTDEAMKGSFEPPVNPKTGETFKKDSKAYKRAQDALDEEIERTRDQRKEKQLLLEFELKQLIEREAIAKKELNYAKMTQDEKTRYIQKKLNEVLKAEEQQANKIRSDYKKLNQELRNTVTSRSAIEEAAKDKPMTSLEKDTYDSLVAYEADLRQKIQQMETDHLKHISDLRISYAIKDAKNIADEIKKRQYSATDALTMASNARTGDEMERAKEAVKSALMTVDKDDLDTIDDLNKAYLNLRASIEKLTKAQKNEQTLQPSIRNEYRRILKELDDLHAAQERLRNTDAYKGLLSTQDAQDAADAMAAFDAREKDLLNKKVKYEQEAGNLLDEVVRENAKRQADIRLQEFEKAQKELEAMEKKYGSITSFEADQVIWDNSHADNVRKSQKAIESLIEARDKLNKYDSNYEDTLESLNKEIKKHEEFIESVTNAEKYREKQEKAYRETYKGAMEYSKQAKSINDLQKAIKYLEAARNAEDLSTEEGKKRYRELTKELNRQKKAFDELFGSVKSNGRNLLNIGDQLTRKLALVFSVSQIQGYIHKLMEVRGEFELQQRSLQAIIQDQDKANEIWQKTVDLAVRSPFRVKELVTYTKQLAAYRIESDKLYETNKMLADVSAGLGVDMNRLILAFGQVRAANFLRGTELRQFTEAGIPMLDELANHLNEMNDTALTSADIFEMISKRMIDFADVEAVFKRLTSEGGRFYQMQEIQAETLQGQMSNLRDSLDLMFNEIGTSSEGVIKRNVERVRTLVENWQRAADILKLLVASFAAYKVNALLTDKALMRFAISQGYATIGASKLTKGLGLTRAAFAKFFTTIKTGLATSGWLLAVTAILDIVMKTVQWHRDLKESIADVNQRYYEQTTELNKLISSYDKLQEAEKEEGANHKKIFNEKKKSLQELLTLAEQNYNIKTSINLDEIAQEDIDAIVEQIENDIIYAKDWGKEFGVFLAKGLGAGEGRFLGIHFFGDNLKTDIEQLNNAISDIGGSTKSQLDAATTELEARYDELSNVAKAAYDELQKGKTDEETEQQWLERRIKLIYKAQEAEEFYGRAGVRNAKEIREAEATREKIARRREEVEREISKVVEKQLREYGVEDFSDLSYEQQILVQYEIDEKFSELQISDELKRWAAAFAAEKFKINYVVETSTPDPKPLLEWQEAYNEYISSFSTDTKKVVKAITDVETERTELAKQVRETKDIYENIVKAYETGAKAYSKAEYEQAKKIVEEAEKAQIWLEGASQDKGKGKDEVLEKLKERINLIKEMNKEYEKLNKTFSKTESLEKVQKAYAETAKELSLDTSTMDFTDEGTIKSLEALLGKPEYAANEYVIELQKALDNFKVELGVEVKQEKDQDLKAQVQELFDQYDLSLELKKLNIPPGLAKSLFDVDYLDLDGLKRAVQAQETKFIGTDMEKEYKDFLDKISELQKKQQESDAKEFVNFLKKNLDEIQVIQNQGAYNISLADKLFGQGKITAEQYMSSIRQIVEETNKETSRVSLENFKESPKYIQAMGDMTAYTASEVRELIKELENVVAANSDAFSADEAKAYIDAIYNAQEKLDALEKSPFRWEAFANIGEILKTDEAINTQKEERDRLQEQEKAQLEELVRLEERLKQLQEEKNAILSGDGDLKSKSNKLAITQSEIDATTNAIQQGQQAVSATQSQAKTTETILGKLGDKMKGLTGKGGGGIASTVSIIDAIVNGINDTVQGVLDITNEIGLVMESFGKETDMSTGFGKFQKGFEIFAESSQHAADGWNALKNGDPVGAVVSVVKSVTSLIRGINEYKDAELQVEIDKQAKSVERLSKAYEKLELATEKAYSIERLQKVNSELEKNIELQIVSYKAMITAESAKKNTDREQIEVWNEELEALTKQWEELKDSLLEGMGGVSEANYRSQTREFVDSWVSAFQETGDGLDGLKNNFREFFDNIIAEQAAMRVTEKFLEPFYESLNEALKDYELTVQESKDLREMVEKIAPDLSSTLEKIWGQLGGSRGESEGGSLSALQKGIQGVTEDTAQIIEAYLNSIRSYVSEQVMHTRNIYRILDDAVHSDAAAIRVKVI